MLPQGKQNIHGEYKGNMQEGISKYHMKQVKNNIKFMSGYGQTKKIAVFEIEIP